MATRDNDALPPCIMGIINEYLMSSKEDIKYHYQMVLDDIELLGEINLPMDNYPISELVEHLNFLKHKYYILQCAGGVNIDNPSLKSSRYNIT